MKQVIVAVLLSTFLGPGSGQLYNKNYKKGFLLIGVAFAGLLGLFAAFIFFVKQEVLKNPDFVLIPGSELALVQKILTDHKGVVSVFKWSLIALWCYSIVDAFLSAGGKKGESKAVTASQMRDIDARCEKEFGVSSLELMENAGRAVSGEALKILQKKSKDYPLVLIFCGKGNNGGDGLAAARNLNKAEVPARVFIVDPLDKPLRRETQIQLEKAEAEGVRLVYLKPETDLNAELDQELEVCDLIIDALLGTGSQGEPTGLVHDLIRKINKAQKSVLAVDIPSGMDADTGKPSATTVMAERTITLGLAKRGLLKDEARPFVGELTIADIGHPKQLLKSY